MLLLTLLACDPWNLPSNGWYYLQEPTWDTNVVATRDGVYVALPAADSLALVKADGSVTPVALDGAEPVRMVAAPDGETVLTVARWPICKDDDPKIRLVSECDAEELSYGTELHVVRAGESVVPAVSVGAPYNAFAFSGDGGVAVAYLDLTEADTIEVSGVLNLTEALFIEVASGEAHNVPIGFAGEDVLFTDDGTKAVVLSRNQVAVVDLASWSVEVSFPLTLDADQSVRPNAVELVTSGGTDYALVSIAGRAELYVLDLTNESIDIVELEAAPSDLLVDTVTDRTLVVYERAAAFDTVEHSFFEVETTAVDEPMNRLLGGEGMALMYSDAGYKDVLLYDTVGKEVVEFRAENPVMDMWLTSDRSRAVATLGTDYGGDFLDDYYGLALFDLIGRGDPITLALQSAPVGVAITEGDSSAYALVLLDGVDALLSVDLTTAADAQLDLEAPPLSIAAIPDGGFVITHPSGLGLMSFFDPATGAVTTVSGFALTQFADEPELPRRDTEE